MQFLSRLARSIEQLDRLAQKYQDEELKDVVAELYKQLTTIINLLEKLYAVYTELDIAIKTDLRLEPGLYLYTEAPTQPEKLAEFLTRLRAEGHDPDRALAYLLDTGAAQLELRDGELYIRPRQARQRY